MSETVIKNTDSRNNLNHNIKQESAQECTSETYKKNFRKDNKWSGDYRKNRGSYNSGKLSEETYFKYHFCESNPFMFEIFFKGFRNNFGNKPSKRNFNNWSNFQSNGKRKKLEVGNRLKECDVGITEFIGNEGFFGVIKERYTDFHVNEIALDGQIAKLTNQDIPSDGEEDENLQDLKKMVSDTLWNQLQKLKESEESTIEIDVTNMDKDQRRAIHRIAKTMKNIISQTIDKENKKIMMILPNKNNSSASMLYPFSIQNVLLLIYI